MSVLSRLEKLEAVTGISKTITSDQNQPAYAADEQLPITTNMPIVKNESSSQQLSPSRGINRDLDTIIVECGIIDNTRIGKDVASDSSNQNTANIIHKEQYWDCYEHITLLGKSKPLGLIPPEATVYFVQ